METAPSKMTRTRWTEESATSVMLAAGFQPLEPFKTVKSPWLSRCTGCGAEVSPCLNDVRRQHGCKVCSGRGEIEASEGEALMNERGYRPLEPYPGRLKPWKCECLARQHVSSPRVWKRSTRTGCIECSTTKQTATSRARYGPPALAVLAERGLDPLEDYPGKLAPWLVRCHECGESYTVRLSKVEAPGWNCPVCRNRANFLRKVSQLTGAGWTIINIPPNGVGKWTVKHDCGLIHEIIAWDAGKQGDCCPACAEHGYDPTEDGYLYLLNLPNHGALKIGITNDLTQRMTTHARNFDFEIVETWGPMNGYRARNLERSVKSSWSAYATPSSVEELPGKTEMVAISDMSAPQTLALLTELTRPPCRFDPSTFTVRPCIRDEAAGLVIEGHYTHTLPATKYLYGLFDGDVLCGVAAFGPPSYPNVARAILPDKPRSAVLDLQRLFLTHSVGANAESWFLSRAIRLLPSSVEAIVAFSDPAVGHHGAVYQATNFLYLGQTLPSYHYENVAGDRTHKRVPWNRARAAKTSERTEAAGLRRIGDVAKYRYALPLSRDARKTLLPRALPYPKPDAQDPGPSEENPGSTPT